MRTYGRVHTAFWTDTKIRGLPERARTLAFYLLTSPHSNMVGAFLLPDAYISDDLGWSISEVSKTIRELIEKGFCKRFSDGRHIAICKFLAYNPVESSGSGKSIARQFNQLPRDTALTDTVQLLKQQLDRLPESFANDLEMIPGTTATSQEQAQSIAQAMEWPSAKADLQKSKKSRRSLPDGFPYQEDLAWSKDYWLKRGRADLCTVFMEEVEKFRDHHSGKLTSSADWSGSWRTWARNTIRFNNGGHNGKSLGNGKRPTAHESFALGALAAAKE